jgi:hypothetical protein
MAIIEEKKTAIIKNWKKFQKINFIGLEFFLNRIN